MAKSALKLVENRGYFRSEEQLYQQDGHSHSLHSPIWFPESMAPELAAYFIERYSDPGQVVFDPFVGGGTTCLEAAMRGRIAWGSDVDPLAVRIAKSKLAPADLTEVTLFMQRVGLKRPVELSSYDEVFSPFYDVDTYREIVNLRGALRSEARVERFVQLLAMSLLHGASAGYFSVYSLPQVALSPQDQIRLNIKRSQVPEYRALVPRVLRRAAGVLREGIPSVLERLERKNRVLVANSQDLQAIQGSSVDLVVTGPPSPGTARDPRDLWLRNWFSGVSADSVSIPSVETLEDWTDVMSSALFELARVVVPGGRAIFDLREVKLNAKSVLCDEELVQLVQQAHFRLWDVEGVILHGNPPVKLKNSLKAREGSQGSRDSRVVILRRK